MPYVQRQLLSNASETGDPVSWPGWRGAFMVEGTFGGATVALQYKTPNGTWINLDATNAALTSAGMVVFECPPGQLRASVSGGTPSALYASVISTDEQ